MLKHFKLKKKIKKLFNLFIESRVYAAISYVEQKYEKYTCFKISCKKFQRLKEIKRKNLF